MSELEKFEGSDAWLARLKSLLFMERPRRAKEDISGTTELKPVIDFSKEFLEELKNQKEAKMPNPRNKENCDPDDTIVPDHYSSKQGTSIRFSNLSQNTTCFTNFSSQYTTHNDSTFYCEEPSILRQTTNESFERLEKMCNKSVSDPDSTLFQYMKSFNESKKSSEQEEEQALERLLKECNIKATLPLADQTQLENIEEPTGMWDNTLAFSDDSNYRQNPSPVKMVGLLRPSTILEESSSSDMTDTSSFSYKTAPKGGYASSDNYETASDSHKIAKTKSENDNNNCNITKDSLEKTLPNENEAEASKFQDQTTNYTTDSDPSSASYTVNKTGDIEISSNCDYTNSLKSTSKSEEESVGNNSDISVERNPEIEVFPHKKHTFYGEDIDQRLICPNDTYNVSLKHKSAELSQDSLYQTKNTMSDVSSLAEDSIEGKKKTSDLIDLNNSALRTPRRSAIVKAKPTIIELSDDESPQEDDLNQGFSLQLDKTDDISNNINISREFNDTIEEMEYIMQQGMKYMTEKGNTPKMVQNVVLSSTKPSIAISTKTLSPSVNYLRGPSPKASPYTPKDTAPKVARKGATSCDKPKPGDAFKKPTVSCTRIPQSRNIFGAKKSNFCHIISPVGAYIKNTPKVPLTANVKPSQDVYHSRAVRELEYEGKHLPIQAETKTKTFTSLPRKAYVSAEYKHVVDQRAPVVIPGGDKIHRYLQPSASVIRHEGKLKMNMPPPPDGRWNAPLNRTVNSSLADLSVMSGDVSLLTIKDAKKNIY